MVGGVTVACSVTERQDKLEGGRARSVKTNRETFGSLEYCAYVLIIVQIKVATFRSLPAVIITIHAKLV